MLSASRPTAQQKDQRESCVVHKAIKLAKNSNFLVKFIKHNVGYMLQSFFFSNWTLTISINGDTALNLSSSSLLFYPAECLHLPRAGRKPTQPCCKNRPIWPTFCIWEVGLTCWYKHANLSQTRFPAHWRSVHLLRYSDTGEIIY